MAVTIIKPVVNSDNGTWGDELNTALDALNNADYFKLKTADQSVTSYTTPLIDDTHLTGMTLPVGTFMIKAGYFVSGGTGSDFRVQWVFSGTAVNSYRGGNGPGAASTDAIGAAANATRNAAAGGGSNALTSPVTYGTDGSNLSYIEETGIAVVTSPGILKVQWAQGTSSATSTILKIGSWLYARQIA